MVNAVFGTDAIKHHVEGITIFLPVGKLDAIVGQDGVDLVGNRSNEMAQELRSDGPRGPLMQLGKSELGAAVNSTKRYSLPSSVRTSAMSM